MERRSLGGRFTRLLEGLDDRQKEVAKKCKTTEELVAFLSREGIGLQDEMRSGILNGELADEALDQVVGGRRVLTQDDLDWLLDVYEPWNPSKHWGQYSSPFQYYISDDQKRIGELPPDEQWEAILNYAKMNGYDVKIEH